MLTPFLRALSAAILTANPSLSLVMIFPPEDLGGGDGEDAGAGADIDDGARTAALEVIVERQQAAARAGMVRRAEGLGGVDLDGKQAARHLAPVMAAMHEKAPGRDRSALPLRQRHPILRSDLLDAERPDSVPAFRLDQPQQGLAAGRLVVMRENLAAALAPVEQSDRDGRRIQPLFESPRDALRL